MKRPRKKANAKERVESEVPDALAAYGERFMSMFDDYDEQAVKKVKQSPAAAAANRDHLSDDSSDSQGNSSDTADDSGTEADSDSSPEQQQQQVPSQAAADRKLAAFLSGRKGNTGLTAPAAAAPRLNTQQLAAQQLKQEQHRLLERKLKKQFMSSKVDKIFDGVQHQQLAAAAAAATAGGDDTDELTPEQFASIKRDVEQLGATALDKRSAKAYKAAMLARLGAAADKRPRMPAKIGLGIMKKAKRREAVALQEAIAAGMVKAKGRGKKERAQKAKGRDKGLQEAGPGFKNGVLRLKKSALRRCS